MHTTLPKAPGPFFCVAGKGGRPFFVIRSAHEPSCRTRRRRDSRHQTRYRHDDRLSQGARSAKPSSHPKLARAYRELASDKRVSSQSLSGCDSPRRANSGGSSERQASASVGALLVLSFRPESRGWLFWKSRDAYSSQWKVMKSSSPVTRAFAPLIAEGLIIRSSLSDGAATRTTMRWSLKLGRPLMIRRANSGGLEHPSPTFP
jgi:hypothetical protein